MLFEEFDTNKILIPKHKSKVVTDKINEYFQEKEIENELNAITEEYTEKSLINDQEDMYTQSFNRKNTIKRNINETVMYAKSIKEEILKDYLASMILESIPLDKDYKDEKEIEIIKKINESIIVRLKGITKDSDLKERLEMIKEDNSDFLIFGIDNLSTKILETISNEKKITKQKLALKEDNKYYDLKETTLFRKILEKNTRFINEEKKDNEIINNEVFAETIIDYSILEGMNTFKLVKFNKKNIKNILKYVD